MKKVFLMMAVVAAVGFSSCKDCLECEGGTVGGQEYCEDNDAARDAFEMGCELGGGSIK